MYYFLLAGDKTLQGILGIGQNFNNIDCNNDFSKCIIDEQTILSIKEVNSGYRVSWTSKNTSHSFKDCYNLNIGETFWFGGPERYVQKPLEQLILDGNNPYIIKNSDNFAVAERYYLNSKGTFIFIHDNVPLFIDQNNEQNGTVCFIAKLQNPYINRNRVSKKYTF